jgi:hypothetical protein
LNIVGAISRDSMKFNVGTSKDMEIDIAGGHLKAK